MLIYGVISLSKKKSNRKRAGRGGFARLFRRGLLLAALLVYSLWCTGSPELTYTVFTSARVPAGFDGLRIAQISDTHDSDLGDEVIRLLYEAKPDIIVITGDMIDSNRVDIDKALRLARSLTEIAPVYWVSGNHEAAVTYTRYTTLTRGLEAAGVCVLENESVFLQLGGDTIQLAGLKDAGFYEGGIAEKTAKLGAAAAFLNDENLFTVMLSHRPEFAQKYAEAGADLVLCGHAHGGQVRLPLIGGLYSPGQGLLPEYDSGLYTLGRTGMYVSRGIGNSTFPLRFMNRPEVVIIELRKGE